jgi:RNA polymerase sigma-70 factor (ECF subfamily)
MSIDSDPRTDAELLLATREDVEAFGVFYRRHVTAVLASVVRRTGDAELGADITAEAFAQALLSNRRYEPARGIPLQWLFGIVAHTLSASARRGSAESRARQKLGMNPVAVEADDVRALEALAAADLGHEAMALLAQLPEGQRELVRARVIDEIDYDELAQEFELTPAAARKRVSRGLEALRHRMKEGPQS